MPGPPIALDEPRLHRGVEALAAIDRDLAGIADRHGPPPLWARPPGFDTLARIILEQQVSLASAEAARQRLVAAAGAVEPAAIVATGEEALRSAGLTRQRRGTWSRSRATSSMVAWTSRPSHPPRTTTRGPR